MTKNQGMLLLAGRSLLGLIFLLAGIGKIGTFEGTSAYMESAGLPMVSVLLVLTIIVEAGGGAALIAGVLSRLAALGLIGFTILASVIFHPFWNIEGEGQQMQQILFLKNLSIVGGLLYVAAFGPGPLSLDRLRLGRTPT